MSDNSELPATHLTKECVVPAIMLIGVAAYWWDAAGLSLSAIAFPLALTATLIAFLGVQLVLTLRSYQDRFRRTEAASATPVQEGKYVGIQRCVVVFLPAGLFMLLDQLGGYLLLFVYLLSLLFFLGEKRKWLMILLAVGLSVSGTAMFKHVLYARIPDGVILSNFSF